MNKELRERLARELFDVWKEAKSSESDNWDNVTWEQLPQSHKDEYILTATRILSDLRILVKAEYPELRFAIDNGETLCLVCHKATENYAGRAKVK